MRCHCHCSAQQGQVLLLLLSVTSAVKKLFDDAWVCQGGDVPQIVVIFGNLPQYPSGDLSWNDSQKGKQESESQNGLGWKEP